MLALAAESGEHPLRHMLTAASGRDLSSAGDMAAVVYWRLPALTPTDPGPLPWLPAIPSTLQAHPVWGVYLAKLSQSVTDLADQIQDHACKLPPSQSGHRRADTRAPPSSAKSQCGGPPTGSIPKTHKQPVESNSKRSRPSGNNASTGISLVPPTRGPTSDRQHTPHLDPGTTTRSARTQNPNGVPAGRPRLADSTPVVRSPALGTWGCTPRGRGRTGSTLPNLALSHGLRIASPRQTSTGVTLMSRAKRTRGAPHSKCPPQRSQAKPSLSASRRGSQGALCRARLRAVT